MRKDPLDEEKATHTSILAWRIPCGLAGHRPWGRKWVGHNLVTKWQQSNNCLLYISEKIGKWKCLTPMEFLKGSYCLDFGFINHILSIWTQKKREKVWKGKMFHGLIDLIPEWLYHASERQWNTRHWAEWWRELSEAGRHLPVGKTSYCTGPRKRVPMSLLHSSHCLRMSENKETTSETLSNLPVNHKYRISERIRTHLYILWASLAAQMVRNPPTMQETLVPSLGWDDAMEKGMANHPSILAWRVPWTEEPGGLQSMGSRGVRHNWANTIFTLCFV